MKDFLLEACVDSTASAEAAHRGGADTWSFAADWSLAV